MRRPETFHHFLDAAGKCTCLLLFNVLAYTSAEKAFTVTRLDATAAKAELERDDGHSGQEIAIIQLCQKDT